MRILCYVTNEVIDRLKSTKCASLEKISLVYPPPNDLREFDENDCLKLDLETSDDVLLIDPAYCNAYASLITYCAFHRKVPVYVCCESDKEMSDVKNALLCSSEFLEFGSKDGIEDFLLSLTKEGTLISFEGGDGVGKQTQTQLMKQRLQSAGYTVKSIDFPHDTALCGKEIRKVLRGDFGTIKEINPVLFAVMYAFNRADLKSFLRFWLKKGYIVILDRYVEANYGHQISKIESSEQKKEMLDNLQQFEHKWLGIPRSDIVLYLDLPPKVADAALGNDSTRASLDIHETAHRDYKETVRKTFLWCSRVLDNWKVVPCLHSNQGRDERLSINEVHAICLEHVMKVIA